MILQLVHNKMCVEIYQNRCRNILEILQDYFQNSAEQFAKLVHTYFWKSAILFNFQNSAALLLYSIIKDSAVLLLCIIIKDSAENVQTFAE